MRFASSIALALIALMLGNPSRAAISLDQAMAHPDWIGPPVESAWWAWDSQRVQYALKRKGSPLRDIYVQAIDATQGEAVGDAGLAGLDAEAPVYSRDRSHMLFLHHDDLFERDLRSGVLIQITRSEEQEVDPRYAADGRGVIFRVGNDWYRWNVGERLVTPAALLRAEKDPNTAEPDALRDMQLRLVATLKRQKDERDVLRARTEQERKADFSRSPASIYLGADIQIDGSALSPNGRWLLLATSAKGAEVGRIGKLQKYVTESGYEETEDERTRVGRNPPAAQTLKLVDLTSGSVRDLSYDALPGIATDPMAALRQAQKLEPLKGPRPVRVGVDENSGSAIRWSEDGSRAVVLIRAIDNKDRWLATVDVSKTDLSSARLESAHRLTDPAWINWAFNEFGWLPDNETLWYLSEESGYSHLYTAAPQAKPMAVTVGEWETSGVQWSADGATAYFLCNRKWPGDYEVCAAPRTGGSVRELTELDGVEDFTLSPDGEKLLIRYSASYLPKQLAVVTVGGGEARKLTDTRSPEYKAQRWIAPQFVQVPSKHGAGTIWAKLYRPEHLQPGKKYPVVMFVHGAGYLQNVSARYPNYFREQMFHNLLVEQGYLVLDMDYRASEGYGRDWRTAIYRQMGHPELDDYLDGVDWMVATQQADPARVGIYGGSYGGFMSFMAMFRAPEIFKAGAALRPVTDWASYNHEYTSNILNTPELDPDAYRTSSPIEYAESLRGHLLIAHGMMDDNVFYQDSVRLAQRLIELKKDHWELASYPLERHSFVQPESWYDEYRRIYQLFERSLK